MKKLGILFLLGGFLLPAMAQNAAEFQALQQENKKLRTQIQTLHNQPFNARLSVGDSDCEPEHIPTTPGGTTWSLNLGGNNGAASGKATFWRYNCRGKNALVMTIAPDSPTKGVYVCPERELAFIQNGQRYAGEEHIDAEAPHEDCGTVTSTTNMVISSDAVNIDGEFQIVFSSTQGAQTTLNIPAIDSAQGSGSISVGESECEPEDIPTTPSGPAWNLTLGTSIPSMGITPSQAKFWRYNCRGKNALVMTIVPPSTTGSYPRLHVPTDTYVCPEQEITLIQNGKTYAGEENIDVDSSGVECGGITRTTNMVISSDKVNINAPFQLVYNSTHGEQTTLNIPAASNTQTGNTSGAVADLTGLWYDPAMNGLGFNLISAPHGLFIYYYGYAFDGKRLWLVSEGGSTVITRGQSYTFNLLEGASGNGANFETKPITGAGVEKWGTLTMTINSCTSAEFVLSGKDGDKIFNTQKLTGIRGDHCVDF